MNRDGALERIKQLEDEVEKLKAQVTELEQAIAEAKRKELGPLRGDGGTGSGRVRKSIYSGKIIVAKHTDDDGNLVNPRREGTWGERSYNIVLETPYNWISSRRRTRGSWRSHGTGGRPTSSGTMTTTLSISWTPEDDGGEVDDQ